MALKAHAAGDTLIFRLLSYMTIRGHLETVEIEVWDGRLCCRQIFRKISEFNTIKNGDKDLSLKVKALHYLCLVMQIQKETASGINFSVITKAKKIWRKLLTVLVSHWNKLESANESKHDDVRGAS